MKVIIDTGSSVLWLNSDYCSLPICKTRPRLKISKKLHQKTSKKLEVIYGDGKVNGFIDTMSVSLANLSVYNQEILAVSHMTSNIIEDVL